MAVITKRPMLNGIVNRISKVGVELEGGWHKPPNDIELQRDSSVRFPPKSVPMTIEDAKKMSKEPPLYSGEIPSPPILVTDVEKWMKKYYPAKVNETCGLHVHMSLFRKLHYQQLMTPEFTTAMVLALKAFAEEEKLPADHPLWGRLNNPNHEHCAHVYCGDKQALQKKKDYNSRGREHSRYTAINYCMGQHGTIECRLLSMMETPDQGVKAVMRVINETNRYLSKIRQKETKLGGSVAYSGEIVQHFESVIR